MSHFFPLLTFWFNNFTFLLFLAGVPVLVLLGYIFWCDRKHPETLSLLATMFGLGCLCCLPAIVVELPVDWFLTYSPLPWLNPLISCTLGSSIPEELLKFTFFMLIIWNHPHFDGFLDGAVYAVFVSLGFAFTENLLYVFGAEWTDGSGMQVGILRAFLSIPGHFLFAIVMGYFLSMAKFYKRYQILLIPLGLLGATLVHAVYNGHLMYIELLSQGEGMELFVGLLFLSFLAFEAILWCVGLLMIYHLSCLADRYGEPVLMGEYAPLPPTYGGTMPEGFPGAIKLPCEFGQDG
ncbi:MAG: PrsW family intramembrane metalloprotease [Planctomycetia bacterium]|nr:PrsW family intramembrane metalloprotease [Planctomycetia bacterium]